MTGPWTLLLCSTAPLVLLNHLLLQIRPGDPTGKYFTAIIWCFKNCSRQLVLELYLLCISPAMALLFRSPALTFLLMFHLCFWKRTSNFVKLDSKDSHSRMLKIQFIGRYGDLQHIPEPCSSTEWPQQSLHSGTAVQKNGSWGHMLKSNSFSGKLQFCFRLGQMEC